MAELVANCPRCGAKAITVDVKELNLVAREYGWATYEAFGVCRGCNQSTIFVIRETTDHDTELFKKKMTPLQVPNALNNYFEILGFIGLKDQATVAPPEHMPPDIANVFREAATCLRVECWNAAGTMFRLCVDLATRPMLPVEDVEGLNAKTRPRVTSALALRQQQVVC
jgi:hypothetical protein